MTTLKRQLFISLAMAALLIGPKIFAETSDYLEEDPYTARKPAQDPAPTPVRPSNPAQPARPTQQPQYQQPRSSKQSSSTQQQQQPMSEKDKRKYFTDQSPRTDAGVFHVGFAAGGNFYIEPQVDPTTDAPTGNFFKDFGFQAGVYFDHDYSELDENIPLMLRGMIGYKYVLSTTHVFAFDGMVRRMFRFSENASFGLGAGASIAVWYRAQSSTSNEEIIFLPSALIGAGFEFNPFMVDFKWSINRIGGSNTIMGFELYFGFRL